MASLQREPTGMFHITFCYGGKRFKRSLNTKSEKKALGRKANIEETIDLVERGRLNVPTGADTTQFFQKAS